MLDGHTIVFDLDGTLADTALDLVRTLNVVLAQEGLGPVAFADARGLIGAGARPLIERGLFLHKRSVPKERVDALYAYFLDHYHANIAVETRLFPGVVAALDELEKAGAKLAVCTNKLESHARRLLETLGVSKRFAAITGKDTFAYFKPDARHFLQTVKRAKGKPGRSLMVGDSMTDVDTARNAGVPVVAVSFGYTQKPAAEFGADLLIHHFDELAAAVTGIVERSVGDPARQGLAKKSPVRRKNAVKSTSKAAGRRK
jgi:phosphoglycolate phosphatase